MNVVNYRQGKDGYSVYCCMILLYYQYAALRHLLLNQAVLPLSWLEVYVTGVVIYVIQQLLLLHALISDLMGQ